MKIKMKMGIALKTFLFVSFIITVVVVLSFGILYFVLPQYYFYTKQKNLETKANLLAENLINAKTEDQCVDLIIHFTTENNASVFSYNTEEKLVYQLSSPFLAIKDSMIVSIEIDENAEQSIQEKQLQSITVSPGQVDKHWIEQGSFVAMSVAEENSMMLRKTIHNNFVEKIEIVSTLQPINEAQHVIASLMPFLLLVDIFIALLAAFFYAKRLTRPILQISQAAAHMRKMIPLAASNVRSNDELGELSKTLDFMYNDLCENIEKLHAEMELVHELERSKTDFMRSASHELKTPIAALNGIVEGMIDKVGVYKDKEKYLLESKKIIDRLTVLVKEIVNASSLDSATNAISFSAVNVSAVMDNVLKQHSWLSKEKRLKIETKTFEFLYETDEKILFNTLSNIVSNATKYTQEEGFIRVNFTISNKMAILSVENQCENIPNDELEKLWEPFYTRNYSRDKQKEGTGLGLYIVKKNLERLQLDYKLENTPLGIKVSLIFPLE